MEEDCLYTDTCGDKLKHGHYIQIRPIVLWKYDPKDPKQIFRVDQDLTICYKNLFQVPGIGGNGILVHDRSAGKDFVLHGTFMVLPEPLEVYAISTPADPSWKVVKLPITEMAPGGTFAKELSPEQQALIAIGVASTDPGRLFGDKFSGNIEFFIGKQKVYEITLLVFDSMEAKS